jgi:peptide/nickel transport system permease protein
VTGGATASRLLQSLLTLLVLSFAVYMLMGLMPGDPVDLMIAGNPHMTVEDAERLRHLYGLDQPLLARYGHWLWNVLHGEAGYSRLYGLPVGSVIAPRLLNSLLLMGMALGLTAALALPLGIAAARRRGAWTDRIINAACLAGISMPPFWLGLLLMALFSVYLGWLPAGAVLDGAPLGARLSSMILPVVTLAAASLAVYVRHLRASLAAALSADHIRTARAKGCDEARVVWHHALRGALIPVVTVFMLDVGALFGGALTIETIFSWPGMGKMMFDAVMGNDFNLALVGFLVMSAFVLAANALADLAYAWLDPRVRGGKGAAA